jgi:hypothetical protein
MKFGRWNYCRNGMDSRYSSYTGSTINFTHSTLIVIRHFDGAILFHIMGFLCDIIYDILYDIIWEIIWDIIWDIMAPFSRFILRNNKIK